MVSCQEYILSNPALLKIGPKIFVDFCKEEKLVYLAARNLSHKIRLGKDWSYLQTHINMLNKQEEAYRQKWSILQAICNDEEGGPHG